MRIIGRIHTKAGAKHIDRLFEAGSMVGLTDRQLLDRFLAGESAEAAFEALVDRHGPMVRSVCRSVLRDAHEADDAFQATFLVLARGGGDPPSRRGRELALWRCLPRSHPRTPTGPTATARALPRRAPRVPRITDRSAAE